MIPPDYDSVAALPAVLALLAGDLGVEHSHVELWVEEKPYSEVF
jgi:hypothetical protein